MLSERRKAHRFVVDPDRAEVTVVVGSSRTAGVLVDLSSSGMGVLVLRGLPLAPGQVIQVEVENVVHDCEVVECVVEEMYQRVGVRRLQEHFDMPDPMQAILKKTGPSDMSAVGTALAITLGLCVAALSFGVFQSLDLGGPTDPAQKPIANARELEMRQRVSTEAERIAQEKDRALREAGAETAARTQQYQEQAAVLLTGSGDFSWSSLVTHLRLSSGQQRDLINLVETGTTTSSRLTPSELRERATDLLSEAQRRRIKQLVTAGRP